MAISFVKTFGLNGANTRRGYSNTVTNPETMSDSEEDVYADEDGVKRIVNNSLFGDRHVVQSAEGFMNGPFSCLTASVRPDELIDEMKDPVSNDSSQMIKFDEFGFVVGESNGENITCDSNEKDLRIKWLTFLDLHYNNDAKPRMKWSQIEPKFHPSNSLDSLVHEGLPFSLRPQLWLRFCDGGLQSQRSNLSYVEMVEKSSNIESLSVNTDRQVYRVLPNNACFMTSESVGMQRLTRVLNVLKWMQRTGLCPTMIIQESINVPVVAAHLLLICEEDETFWLIHTIINDLKSLDHQIILKMMIKDIFPDIHDKLVMNDIEISLITWHWFSSLFASFFNNFKTGMLFQFWDFYFYYGPVSLFQLIIGLLEKVRESLTVKTLDSADLFNLIEDLPSHINSSKNLRDILSTGYKLVPHLSQKFGHDGTVGVPLPLRRDKGMLSHEDDEMRQKNIVHTNILVELHQSIEAIAQHFETYDDTFRADLNVDLNEKITFPSLDSLEKRQKLRHRLAKALVDFTKRDPDELGFKKNDILIVLNERDEHCWVGEINGEKGWFPAKFVELLEQHYDYNIAGDDQVVGFINDLVRGRFCSVFKAILFNGLIQNGLLITHPWTIIETVAAACIASDLNSVYSRLVLTKTYKLDESCNRVLTPCEILYRNVNYINQTHKNEPMDIKLRSLVCMSLNQQMLHEFFTIICLSQTKILKKYYQEQSYLRSPVWRLVRAELRLLTQFVFNLNPLSELPESCHPKSPVSKDGVRDMLVKHHLFSWDI